MSSNVVTQYMLRNLQLVYQRIDNELCQTRCTYNLILKWKIKSNQKIPQLSDTVSTLFKSHLFTFFHLRGLVTLTPVTERLAMGLSLPVLTT